MYRGQDCEIGKGYEDAQQGEGTNRHKHGHGDPSQEEYSKKNNTIGYIHMGKPNGHNRIKWDKENNHNAT